MAYGVTWALANSTPCLVIAPARYSYIASFIMNLIVVILYYGGACSCAHQAALTFGCAKIRAISCPIVPPSPPVTSSHYNKTYLVARYRLFRAEDD
jgi:hypothetical protein